MTEKKFFPLVLQKIKSFQKQTVKVRMKQLTMELIKEPGKTLHPNLTWSRKREMRTDPSQGKGHRTKKQKTLVWNNVLTQMTGTILSWKGDRAGNLHFPGPAISYFKRLVDNSMISDIANQTNCIQRRKIHINLLMQLKVKLNSS